MDWARLVATKPQGPTVIAGVRIEGKNTELRSAQRDRQAFPLSVASSASETD